MTTTYTQWTREDAERSSTAALLTPTQLQELETCTHQPTPSPYRYSLPELCDTLARAAAETMTA